MYLLIKRTVVTIGFKRAPTVPARALCASTLQ
jgi:hypothetical protein